MGILFIRNGVVIVTIIYVAFCSAASSDYEIWEATNLNAVTHFEGIEDFYLAKREDNTSGDETSPPREPTDPKERVRVKKKLCKNILTSHFFRMRQADWVQIDHPKIREELKRDHRDTIFYNIFHEYEYAHNFLPQDIKYGYDYANLYRERAVRIGELEKDEFVFICPARESEIIKAYFISRAYNVNTLTNSIYAYTIAGRFIFSHDENLNDNALKIVALAEDSPLGSGLGIFKFLVNFHYAHLRWRIQPAENPEEDVVCLLEPAERLRLCSLIFSMPDFKHSIRFSPIMENVLDCEKKQINDISFKCLRQFDEWVIGCKARTRRGKEVIYYVSHGSGFINQIFIYSDGGEGKISLYDECDNVSVIRASSHGGEDAN